MPQPVEGSFYKGWGYSEPAITTIKSGIGTVIHLMNVLEIYFMESLKFSDPP